MLVGKAGLEEMGDTALSRRRPGFKYTWGCHYFYLNNVYAPGIPRKPRLLSAGTQLVSFQEGVNNFPKWTMLHPGEKPAHNNPFFYTVIISFETWNNTCNIPLRNTSEGIGMEAANKKR